MNTKYNIPKIYEDVKSRSKILSLKDKNYFYNKHQLLINTTKSISERISETKKHFKLSIEINTKTEKTIETIKKNKNIEDIFSTSLFNKSIINSLHFIAEEELIPIKTNSIDMLYTLFGLDNINEYYDTELKISRLDKLRKYENFFFEKIDIADRQSLSKAFNNFSPDIVVNLAAQAGVRYSIENPYSYIDSNIIGFQNLIELNDSW